MYLGEKLVFFEENYDENYEKTAHAKKKSGDSEWLIAFSCLPAEHREDPKCPSEPKNDILQTEW